jgi:hypothetical protein
MADALRSLNAHTPSGAVQGPGPNGLVSLGDTKSGRQLEGKAFMGFNSDMIKFDRFEQVASQPDLSYELLVRDFACNALFYDPINRVVIDISGFGIEDSQERILRIPVERGNWDQWADCNPTKLLRFFVFLARGYKPADMATVTFIRDRIRSWFLCPDLTDTAACAAHQAASHPMVKCFLTKSTFEMRFKGMVKRDRATYLKIRDEVRKVVGDDFATRYMPDSFL